jgi:carbamoyltransferase
MKITPTKTISLYGSHDASATFIDKYNNLRVYEYERFVKKRYAMFSSDFDSRPGMGSNQKEREDFLNLIKENLIDTEIELVLYSALSESDKNLILTFFPKARFEQVGHHYAHACSGFYNSNFKKSLIFSVDGGGTDDNVVSSTRVYFGENDNIVDLNCPNLDYGNPYSAIGFLISEIKPGAEGETVENSLVYAGKIMGLCAYGKIRQEWVQPFINYYSTNSLKNLCHELNIPYGFNTTSGQLSYDLAATSQFVFETKMDELIMPYIDKYNTDIVLVGGCALNVLYNQKLYERLCEMGLKLFVPPNPNDCGQSYGIFLSKFPNFGSQEIAYSGIQILDEQNLNKYEINHFSEEFSYVSLVNYLKEGKIIGILNGNSEVGPRALGNRSIICYPSFPEMKDILNAKVKFREWYRPFAPVCRIEDANTYFKNARESKYMSYAPKVKEEFEDKLKSIVHTDKTTRLQTTTLDQHPIFYNILSEMKNQDLIPVILNTSFNIRGFPILTTIEDAFFVLDNTELDILVIGNKIFKKNV